MCTWGSRGGEAHVVSHYVLKIVIDGKPHDKTICEGCVTNHVDTY